jgi:hypothetical protein
MNNFALAANILFQPALSAYPQNLGFFQCQFPKSMLPCPALELSCPIHAHFYTNILQMLVHRTFRNP